MTKDNTAPRVIGFEYALVKGGVRISRGVTQSPGIDEIADQLIARGGRYRPGIDSDSPTYEATAIRVWDGNEERRLSLGSSIEITPEGQAIFYEQGPGRQVPLEALASVANLLVFPNRA